MAFTGSFTKTNDGATALDAFIIADTSSYADEAKSTFTGRRVYLYDYQGNKIYPASQEVIVLGVAPTATITISSVPADGYNIIVSLPVSMGSLALGSYTKQSSDTTTTILAASIAAALSGSGVTITSALNVVTIQFDTETSDYNGDSLDITSSDVAEVNAYALFSVNNLIIMPSGRVLTFQAQLPDDSYVTIGTYTIQPDDTTAAVMGPRLVTAITGNIYGFVPTYSPTNLRTTSPSGYGATINTKQFLITYSGGSASSTFSNGVTAIGVIPNTATDFAGGQTAGTEILTGLDYYDFPFSMGDELLINTLTADAAIRIDFLWESSDPQQGSTYTDSEVFDFLDYANQFKYGLIQDMAINRSLVSNKNFFETLSILQANIDASSTSISNDDQYESQMCIINTQYIMANLNLFY